MGKIFKKSLVIGFKKGLGKELFKSFQLVSDYIHGVDLAEWEDSNGNELIFFEKYIQTHGYDLIILNAHLGFNAPELLKKICGNNKKNTLIVIGSIVTDQTRKEYYKYYLEKLVLEKTVRQLQFQYKDINLTLFKPGWINTDFVKNIIGKKMSPKNVAKYILENFLLNRKYKFQQIQCSFIRKD